MKHSDFLLLCAPYCWFQNMLNEIYDLQISTYIKVNIKAEMIFMFHCTYVAHHELETLQHHVHSYQAFIPTHFYPYMTSDQVALTLTIHRLSL